jgi:hypothetical protein
MEKYETDYDLYFDELIALNAVLGNFQQITNNDPIIKMVLPDPNNNLYNSKQSLLYGAETEEFVEFVDGKPGLFVKYYTLIVIGSSKIATDCMAMAPVLENVEFHNCNFYLDYFKIHPLDISMTNCSDGICNIETNIPNKNWCQKCYGNFTADKLLYLLHPQIRISEMPRDSIIFIHKNIGEINHHDLKSLVKVKNFLINDKKKIDLIQTRINNADERMKKFIDIIQIENKFNHEKLTKLLADRGGSIYEYHKTIDEINDKIKIFDTNINIIVL